MFKKCKYCYYSKKSYKTILKHQNKCIFKPTFLDMYYDKVISNNILKKEYPDVKYIVNKQNITSLSPRTSYGNKLHIEIYKNKKLEDKQIDFDVIFIDQYHKMKGMQIEIKNIKTYDNEYTVEILEYNLQNKDKINKLWSTIKYRFMDNLLILCQVLPLIIDLHDEINTIIYSQWLLNNGYHFAYKFGDNQLIFDNNFKDNFIDQLKIKNMCIGSNINYDISKKNIYNDEKELESIEYLIKAHNVCLCYMKTQGTGPDKYIIEVKINDIKIDIEFERKNAFWDNNEQNYIIYDVHNNGKTKVLKKVNGEVVWFPIYKSYYKYNIEINNIKAVLNIEKSKNVLNNLSYWNIHFNLNIDI